MHRYYFLYTIQHPNNYNRNTTTKTHLTKFNDLKAKININSNDEIYSHFIYFLCIFHN